MADRELNILLRLKDDASTALGKFGKQVGALEPQFKTMALVGGAAFAAVGAVIYKSVGAANEAALVQAQLGAVLKSTAGIAGVTSEAAIQLSKSLESTTTFSDEAVLSTENLLLTFTKIGKDIFPQATSTVLDMATALGEDTKSASIQLGKALQDPILGINALRRVGVNFSDAQKDVIQKLVDTGHAAEAQKAILKELNTEFGGSAAAKAKTYAGQVEQIKNQMNDLQEVVGNGFLPILSKMVQGMVPLVTKLTEWAQAHPKLVTGVLAAVAALAGIVTAVGVLGVAFNNLKTLVTASIQVFQGLGKAFLFLASNPALAIIILIVAAIAALAYVIYKNKDAIAKWFVDGWNTIKDVGNQIKDFFVGLWSWISDFFSQWGTLILAFLLPFIGIPLLIYENWGTIVSFFTNLWDSIKSAFLDTMTNIVQGVMDWWNGLSDGARGWIALFLTIITGGLFALAVQIYNNWDEIKATTIQVWQEISDFFVMIWTNIVNFIMPIVTTIANFFKTKWLEMQASFTIVWTAIKTFFIAIWDAIRDAIAERLEAAKNNLASNWAIISGAITTAWTAIKKFFADIWASIVGVFESAITNIMKKIQPLLDAIDRVKGGLSSIGGKIGSNLSNAGSAIGKVIGVNDALITSKGDVVQFHPDDNILAFKKFPNGGGGGISIIINGDVSGEDIVDKVSSALMNRLSLNMRV